MKTDKLAETIAEYVKNKYYPIARSKKEAFDLIYNFMQEYHKKSLRDELIKFLEFQMACSTKIAQLPNDKFIEEYLKQRL